jgi:peroxiredoxin
VIHVERAETFALGGSAPDFEGLLGVDGSTYSLSSFAGKELLAIIFSCNGCPTVRGAEDGLVALQDEYANQGVQLLAINANNAYLSPSDTYAEMVRRAEEKSFNFPYVKDEDGSVARLYGARRTPHVFLLDRERKLRYRGRIADSRDPAKVTRRDLACAVEELLTARDVEVIETEPSGCAIVW